MTLFGLPREQRARDPDGDRRRLRRQGRVPVDDRRARGAAGVESGPPVKIVYDREEDMAATTKRHPSRTRHRTAVTRDGKLLAMDIDFVLDGGAYATLSPVVLSRGTIHAAGPYFCPNVRIRSQAVATNTPPHGAFRGFGAPQSIFALERHMDQAASRSASPRRSCAAATSSTRARRWRRAGGAGEDGHGRADGPRARAERLPGQARALCGGEPGRAGEEGDGLRVVSARRRIHRLRRALLASVVGAEATPDGRVRVLAASTEMGQGTNTMFAQIAAEALGVDYDMIEMAQPDTAVVPNSGPTVASRTCMVVGKLVESAALGIRQQLLSSGLLPDTTHRSSSGRPARVHRTPRRAEIHRRVQRPAGIHWDDENYRGDAYGAYAWAVYVAEVAVDMTTYEMRVDDFVALQEVGRVINPVLAAGQIEGGVAQGIGWALYENVVWQDGRMVNSQMTNYIMPTSADLPRIRVFFEEEPYAHGPGGAKGIGELPMDGPAPAILNAIENALGVSIKRIPVTPEVLMEALERRACLRRCEDRRQLRGQRRAAHGRGLSHGAAAGRAARGPAPHRHQRRLRRRRVRRLLGAHRRRAGEQLPGAGGAGGGRKITTIEGIVRRDAARRAGGVRRVRRAQCGICTPGMVLAAVTLLERHSAQPTEDDIRNGLAGNLCRCTGYMRIFEAVLQACEKSVGAGA